MHISQVGGGGGKKGKLGEKGVGCLQEVGKKEGGNLDGFLKIMSGSGTNTKGKICQALKAWPLWEQ